MIKIKEPEYIVNSRGRKVKVILDYKHYQKLLEIAEDKEDSELIEKTIDESEISLEDFKKERKLV